MAATAEIMQTRIIGIALRVLLVQRAIMATGGDAARATTPTKGIYLFQMVSLPFLTIFLRLLKSRTMA